MLIGFRVMRIPGKQAALALSETGNASASRCGFRHAPLRKT